MSKLSTNVYIFSSNDFELENTMAFLAAKSGRHVYGRMHFLGAA